MSEENKVSLSNVDRGINAITAFNSYKNTKISEAILTQQIRNNKHLADMNRQMNEANETNRHILKIQIRELERKEEQKYYKAFSFNTHEIVDHFDKINDPMVLNYVMSNYFDKLRSNINIINDALEEINDKVFNKQIFEKLSILKIKTETNSSNYSKNVLSKIDNLIADHKEKKERISGLKKPVFVADKNSLKSEIDISLRAMGIIVLSVTFGVCLISSIVHGIGINSVLVLLITGIALFFLIRSELKHNKEFALRKAQENAKRVEFEKNKKLALEQQYVEELLRQKEILINHPVNEAIQEINANHPTLEQTTTYITELEVAFLKKYGAQ